MIVAACATLSCQKEDCHVSTCAGGSASHTCVLQDVAQMLSPNVSVATMSR
jgi:transcriptional regulator GlxA family with amidase domain